MKCSVCQQEVEYRAFATFRGRDGTVRRRGICKECRGRYALENFDRLQAWRRDYNAQPQNRTRKQVRDRQRRAEGHAYVDGVKARTPCADCGNFFPPVCMDFDHVRGGKIRGVSNLVGGAYRLELIKEEIAKCELVCANCHRLRTARNRENLAPSIATVPRHATGTRTCVPRASEELVLVRA